MKAIISVLGFASLVLISLPSQAKIIHVPTDSSTIQKAVDGAYDGDTVMVAPGKYVENIHFYCQSPQYLNIASVG